MISQTTLDLVEKSRLTEYIWEKPLLTVREAARYAGVGAQVIYKMMDSKGCPFVVKFNDKRLINRTKFENVISNLSRI